MQDLRPTFGNITSLCERGVDADGGIYRPTFFHANRRLRLIVGESGNIIRRSMIDFGNRPIPAKTRNSGL
jgi:hypothetical protein